MIDELLGRHAGDLAQRIGQCPAQLPRHHDRIAMRTAHGFIHDAIDQTQVLQTRGSNCQRLGSRRGLVGTTPENRCTAFRGNHRIGGVLQHHHHVATAMARAPPEPPSPMMVVMMGTLSSAMAYRLWPMASDWPRSSAPMPGYAPGVSTKVKMGSWNFSARRISRNALR